MADEQHVVRGISWTEAFGLTHVFKSFKMAIHPSKLCLALAAIALTYALGVWIMDPLWSLSKSAAVHKDEPWLLWFGWVDKESRTQQTAGTRAAFLAAKRNWIDNERASSLAACLGEYPQVFKDGTAMARDDFAGAVKALRSQYAQTYLGDKQKAESEYLDRRKIAEGEPDSKKRTEALREGAAQFDRDKAQALGKYVAAKSRLDELTGPGVLGGFLAWEKYCLANTFISVRRGSFLDGLTRLFEMKVSKTPKAFRAGDAAYFRPLNASDVPPEGLGLACWLILMAWGVCWMASVYPMYALSYCLAALAVWSIFGGAICRMSALHAAREEKISMSAALRFALSKFFSFFTAPLLPLAIIAVLGAFLLVGGLIGAIPWAGEWLVAVFFFIALVLGLLMAFLTVGLAGGAPLMWPTIAVEGSESFDAISRSFSYVFARPFRYGLYWLTAVLHGTACYLFVRLFAYLALRWVYCWTGWGMSVGWGARNEYVEGAGKLNVLWAEPTFDSFAGPFQSEAMNTSERLAACVLNFWVYVVSGVVLAFLACYLFSAATNIYYLLRRQVDATDLDDVYVEGAEGEPGGEAALASAAPAAEPPASGQSPPADAPKQSP